MHKSRVQHEYKPRRWRSNHMAWLFLATIVAIAGLTVYTFFAYRRAAVELLLERNRQVAYLSAARMRNEIIKLSDSLEALARTPGIADGDPVLQRQTLQQAMPIQQGIFDDGILLLDNYGRVVASEPAWPEIVGQDWSDRDYFRRLLSSPGPIFSDAVNDSQEGHQVIIVSVPVFGAQGRFAGVLAGRFRLGESTISPFYASIVRLRLGQSGNTYVVDNNGAILFDSGGVSVGLPFSEFGLPGLTFTQDGGVVRTHDAENHLVLAAYAPVPGTPWTLVIEDDWKIVTWETQRYINLLLLLLGIGMILPAAGALALLGARNAEAMEEENTQHELRLANLIKDTLLPDHAPILPGWRLSVFYRPASNVSGDFHDFLLLPDGRLMMTIGDIHDTGMAATTLLATTRTTLRTATRCLLSPAEVLNRSNEFLSPETPDDSAVTCFYSILDPVEGILHFVGAGHDLVYLCQENEMVELCAEDEGDPLAVRLDTKYEERSISIAPGEYLFLCNRGLLDAPTLDGELFGAERLKQILKRCPRSEDLIDAVQTALHQSGGRTWEEEENIVMILLEHLVPTTPSVTSDIRSDIKIGLTEPEADRVVRA